MTNLCRRLSLGLLLSFGVAAPALAYTVKCDKEQKKCYVKTRRMVPGDWVGIFDQAQRLIAIGKIDEIIGETRQIRIMKRYSPITSKSGLKRIRDEVLENPGAYYRIYRGPAKFVAGLQAGVASIGIGNGLAGFGIEGVFDYRITRYLFATARGFFTYGRGEAAIEQGEFVAREVSVSFFGGLAGLSVMAEPISDMYLRGELTLGMAGVAGDTADGVIIDEAVDGRVKEGFGFATKFGISAIYNRMGAYQPYFEAALLRVQEANAAQLSLGLRFNL